MTSANQRIVQSLESRHNAPAARPKAQIRSSAKAFGAQLGLAMGVSALKLPDAPKSKSAHGVTPPAQTSQAKAQQTTSKRPQPTRHRLDQDSPAAAESDNTAEPAATADGKSRKDAAITQGRDVAQVAAEATTPAADPTSPAAPASPAAATNPADPTSLTAEPASNEPSTPIALTDSVQAAGAAATVVGDTSASAVPANDASGASGEARDPLGLIARPRQLSGGLQDGSVQGGQVQDASLKDEALQLGNAGQTPETPAQDARAAPHASAHQNDPAERVATAGMGSQATGVTAPQVVTEPAPAGVGTSAKAGREASVDGVLGLRDLGRSFGTLTARAVGKAPLTVETTGETAEAGGSMEAQLARGLMAAMRHKGGVLTLRLSPEHLGDVRVELVVENGKVSATFDAHNEQTRQLLHANLDSLKKAVEERGMVIDRVQVVGAGVGGAQAPSKPEEPGQGRENLNQQHNEGQSGSSRDQQGQRERSREASEASLADGTGGIFAQEIDPAHGLLRLRLDAIV